MQENWYKKKKRGWHNHSLRRNNMKNGLTTYHLHLKIRRINDEIEKHQGCPNELIELRKERYIAKKQINKILGKK